VDVGQPGEHARRRSGQFGFGQGAARGDGVSEGAALHEAQHERHPPASLLGVRAQQRHEPRRRHAPGGRRERRHVAQDLRARAGRRRLDALDRDRSAGRHQLAPVHDRGRAPAQHGEQAYVLFGELRRKGEKGGGAVGAVPCGASAAPRNLGLGRVANGYVHPCLGIVRRARARVPTPHAARARART